MRCAFASKFTIAHTTLTLKICASKNRWLGVRCNNLCGAYLAKLFLCIFQELSQFIWQPPLFVLESLTWGCVCVCVEGEGGSGDDSITQSTAYFHCGDSGREFDDVLFYSLYFLSTGCFSQWLMDERSSNVLPFDFVIEDHPMLRSY